MDKKYTVFVSSTYEDLKLERDAVVKALLEMGHIPVGMEMFSAADETQWKLIKRNIDESDYYIVIVAHRYGSLDGAISFTEKECDYAASSSVPILGLIIKPEALWSAHKIEHNRRVELDRFKDKIREKTVSFWSTAEDLAAKAILALGKQIAVTPRPGWVRGNQATGADVANEISRLSRENSELRGRVASSPAPQFEIVGAYLQRGTATKRQAVPRVTILIHYSGPLLYIPKYRCEISLSTAEGVQAMRDIHLMNASELIGTDGGDLQIKGSGFLELYCNDVVAIDELGGKATVLVTIKFKHDLGVRLSAELSAPNWRFAEPGSEIYKWD